PKHGEAEFGIGRLDKGAGHAIPASDVFGCAIDQIAEQASAVVELDEGDDVRFFALPLRLHGATYDGESLDRTSAGAFLPRDRSVTGWASLRRRPAKMPLGFTEGQQQAALARGFPVRRGLAAVSRRRIFHVASSSRTPWVAKSPPMPWVMVIFAS